MFGLGRLLPNFKSVYSNADVATLTETLSVFSDLQD